MMLHSGRQRLGFRRGGLNSLNTILKSNTPGNAVAISKIVGGRTILTSFHEPIGSSRPKKNKTSWQPEDNVDIQKVTQTAIIHELTQQQSQTISSVVPWFLDTMPSAYFRQVPYDFRVAHIKAISAVIDANMDLYLNLRSPLPNPNPSRGEGEVLTFIRPGKKMGQLRELIEELPWVHNTDSYVQLSRMQIFTADDESMTLSMFIYGDVTEETKDLKNSGERILEYAQRLQNGEFLNSDRVHPKPSSIFEREKILAYLAKCSETYVSRIDPFRFLHHMELYQKVSGTDRVAVVIHKSPGEQQFWIDIATANSLPQVALEHATRLLYRHQLDVQRCHLDVVTDDDNGNVSLLRILASPMLDSAPSNESLQTLKRQLKRTKWLDPATMDLAIDRYPDLGLDKAEIITAISALMHPIMAKKNSFIFSRANILETITNPRYITHSSNIAELFLDRFNPRNHLSDADFALRCDKLREEIESQVEDTSAGELLNKMIDVVQCTLKTNMYLEERYSLALRLNPKIMHPDENQELPYGVFFVHGRRFNGYHVRFRDIARGGMRLVTPHSVEQLSLESARHYDECYGLAFAQQMKNKDIPEGGSKAVVLINHGDLSSQTGKNLVARKSVKAFTDSLLDLIVDTEETRDIVDLLGKKELLYLGPDEQVIPQDINWVVRRAAQRGYDTPAAFMSSKPRAGINHKEYGVTSEGVNVFLDVALREALNIDPTKETFTIKMTGGPDGDVAGNEIKILFREYGDNAKIVGICDHSGSAEDPNGLDREELLRLVNNSLCISNFNESKLSQDGVLHLVSTEEGVNKRNTMHNRVVADVFVPCGGRPSTIDKHNYKNFLVEDGKPSSHLVVEAANIFITEEARQALHEEAGVIIVKDSSANKCGVITSSYEICAAMLLTEEEFFENKGVIVDEVLAKLRDLAKMEASLLFREFKHYKGSCPHFSKVISKAINNVKDEVIAALDNASEDDIQALLPLFRNHLPKTMADLSFDRVSERVPKQYIRNAIASSIASKIVYREGTIFVESQPKESLAKLALEYIEKEKEIVILKEALQNSDMPEDEKNNIIELLEVGGVRAAMKL